LLRTVPKEVKFWHDTGFSQQWRFVRWFCQLLVFSCIITHCHNPDFSWSVGIPFISRHSLNHHF